MQKTQSSPSASLRSRLGGGPWFLALGALLILQIVLVVLVYWPQSEPVNADAPLFADFDPAAVTSLLIADKAGTTVEIARQAAGEWVLPQQDGFPVKAESVTALLEKVKELQSNRLVASSPASYDRLGVGESEFERKVTMRLENGSEQTLIIGAAPRSRATHVRRQDQAEVFLAATLTANDAATQISNWIDTTYFSVVREEIKSLSLTNDKGIFQFVKDEAGEWTLTDLKPDEEFNPNNLASVITTLTGVIMVQPVGKTDKPEYGFLTPQATITLVTAAADGQETTRTLRVGAKDAENRYYVSSSDSPYIAQVNAYTVERILERTRADFLVPPPAEGPALPPTPVPSE